MKRQDLLNKINFFHKVEFQSECNCDFDWFITPDGVLGVNTTHDICHEWFKLYVDENLIMEKYSSGQDQYYCGFSSEDVPQAIINTMRLPDNGVGALNLEIAHFVEKRDALAVFIKSYGCFPEQFNNFFLLVNYHQHIPISWEEAEDWAMKYLNMPDPYFVFVDNTKFIDLKCQFEEKDIPVAERDDHLCDKALIRATFPLLDTSLLNIWEQFRDILYRCGLAGKNIEIRVEMAQAIKELEADLQKANRLVDCIEV